MSETTTDAAQITAAIEKFDPAVASVIRSVRAALRRRFPTAYELVYDNYNFFVIGFCSTERPSSCIVSLAAQAKGVSLSFYRGADVPDPDGLLAGDGKQNRFLRLPEGAKTLARPDVQTLLRAAEALAPAPMRASGKLVTELRSVSAKQRPRRARS
jgi:hypothetical protein